MRPVLTIFLFWFLIFSNKILFSQSMQDTSMNMKCHLDNTTLCSDKKEVYLYVDLKGSTGSKRLPLNLSLVLDRSGSMEEDGRMRNAHKAVNYLIDHLSPIDNLSIVTYDHFVDVLHESTPVLDRDHLKHKVNRISPRGATNISGGLTKGYEEVKSTFSTDRINRVLLLSDGHANEGITDHYLLDMIAKEHADANNISLSTFGMGHSFNEKLMHDLAESGGGNFYYIEKPEDAAMDFTSEIKLLLGVVAKNATLKINFSSQFLTLNRVYGHSYKNSNGVVNVDLKEVHPNEVNGILLKFIVKENFTVPLKFENILTYTNPNTMQAIEKRQTVSLTVSDDDESCRKNFDKEVLNKIVYFTSNYLLETAMTDVDNGHIDAAHSKLNQAKQTLGNGQELPADSNLKKQYDAVHEYHESVGNMHKMSHHEKKLVQKKAKHTNYKLRKLKQ